MTIREVIKYTHTALLAHLDLPLLARNAHNNIQCNPKLVLPMDDLTVADMGTTGHYLTLDSPCSNNKKAVYPLPIQILNGEVIKYTHTALLAHPYLPLQARQAHIFPGLTKTLLSIGTLC